MKKIFAWFGVILLTFAFGIFSTLTWLKFNQQPIVEEIKEDLPILSICELVNNPDKYNGQTVRLSADLHENFHGYYLADWNCSPQFDDNKLIALLFNEKNQNEIDKKLDEIKKSNKYVSEGIVRFIAVGKFRIVEKCDFCSDSMIDRTQLHFELAKIEKGYLNQQ